MAKKNVTAQESMSTSQLPDHEQRIRERAYQFFEQRGREPGHEWDDWVRAEAEVLETRQQAQAA